MKVKLTEKRAIVFIFKLVTCNLRQCIHPNYPPEVIVATYMTVN